MLKLKTAKAYESFLGDENLKREFDMLAEAFSAHEFNLTSGTVNAVLLGVSYVNIEKKLHVEIAFANMMEETINEIHAKLFLNLKNIEAEVAVATVDFDAEFLGELKNKEAVYLNLKIPVRGLKEDREFTASEYTGRLDEVRVSFAEKEEA